MSEVLKRALTVVCAFALVLAAMALPVAADDDDDDDEASASSGPLEVEARPAIVGVGGLFVVEAEYEVDGDSDDSDDSEDGDSDDPDDGNSDGPDDGDSDDSEDGDSDDSEESDEEDVVSPANESVTVPTAAEFVVDFGDGSAPQAMTVTEEDADGDEYEAEAVASHRYETEGVYPVTVTVSPSAGQPVAATVEVAVGSGGARMSGDTRFDTSTRLSREAFPVDGSAEAVLLARGDAFADALAAGALTLLEDAPVLLTATAQVPAGVLDEIARALGEAGTVYVLGGEAAVAPAVVDALSAMGYEVERISGADRVATAVQIARFMLDAGVEVDEVVLAAAGNFPDAIAGASFAALEEAPVLLTGSGSLDPRVEALLRDLGAEVDVLVLGGPAAISATVVDQVKALGNDAERLSGKDRYATSAAVADALFADSTAVVIATGAKFPDALSGSSLAARHHAPVLLVGATTLPAPVRDYLVAHADQIDVAYVLGGRGAVSPAVRAEIEQLLGVAR